MRMEFILPNLAVGGAINTRETMYGSVTKRGITHIINLDKVCVEVDTVPTLHYYIHDDGFPKPDSYYISTISFALEVLRTKNTKLLVHCAAGRNRSVSITYAILRCLGYSPDGAKDLIEKNYTKPLEARDPNFKRPDNIRYEQDVENALCKYGKLFGAKE